jgi:hypothetical protein
MFSHNLQTPMAQGTAAFATLGPAQRLAEELNGEVFDWDGLLERHKAGKLMVDASLPRRSAPAWPANGQPRTTCRPAGRWRRGQYEAEVDGYQVHLLSAAPLHAGYNTVTVAAPDQA